MITEILTCALMFSSQTHATADTIEVAQEEIQISTDATNTQNDKFWAKKKSLRIGYDFHTYQNDAGRTYPIKISAGLSRTNNIWLHKKPIAGVMKFAFDIGFNLSYSMFDTSFDTSAAGGEYAGPSGYLGPEESLPDDFTDGSDEESFDVSSIGMHYLSLGVPLGASLTVNPVAQLRLNGYFHFVPSVSLMASDTALPLGFMPYCKYGAEITYNWFGAGVEWGSGMSNMTDMMSRIASKLEGTEPVESPKAKYYSNYMRVYLAFRLGKNKKKR